MVAADTTAGDRPFIGALDNNNGVARFVSDTNESLDKNVLGVNYNGNGIKAFSIDVLGNQLRIATPKTNEQTHYVTEYYFDSVTYSFIRTRENVKETVE